jgi:hypothetical protein
MGYELRKIRLKLTAKSPEDLIDHLTPGVIRGIAFEK